MKNNVALANKDQMDQLVYQAEMVIQEHLVMTDNLADPVLMLKSEMNYCLYHHNAHAPESLDLLDHLDNEATMDHPETMAPLETTDDLEMLDLSVHLDSLDNPDDPETEDHLENPELFDPDKLHHPANPVNLDVPDNLDNPADLEKLAKMVTTDHPANLAALETLDHPAATENQEAQENLETLELQEAATTAHQLVWHPDIRTKLCRGHLIYSFLTFLCKFSLETKLSNPFLLPSRI